MPLSELLGSIAGCRVTVMALGHYEKGTGIEAVKFFMRHGARVRATDLAPRKKLKDQVDDVVHSYEALKREGTKVFKPIFVLGCHREQDFKKADLIMHGPSVPADSKYLAIAKSAGVPITNDWGIFFALKQNPVLAITGTRGKSTVTALLHEMVKKKYRNAKLAGNIGVSPLHFIDSVNDSVPVVAELSSWLLHYAAQFNRGPHIAVITNIMRDHLNKYGGMEEYIADKEQIFARQEPSDYAILNRDNEVTRDMGKRVRAKRFWVSIKPFADENGIFKKEYNIIARRDGKETILFTISDIRILGEHNVYNTMYAALAAWLYGVPASVIKSTVRAFKGLPNRLELVRAMRGIKFYNDTAATTPDGVIAALRALGKQKNIVLICGGMDKKLQFREMARAIKKYCKALVLLEGDATEKLKRELPITNYQLPTKPVSSMTAAVRQAVEYAKAGDIVILSPGAASFNMFQDEFDRGRAFVKAVRAL